MKARLLAGLLLAAPAAASSPAAWAAHDKAAAAACITASGLKAARASKPVLLSDSVGTAILISGIYPQKFMRNARGTMLCIYDRRTRKAEAVEAKGWTAP